MVVTLLMAVFLIQKLVLFPTFESLEQQFAKADIDRVEEVILTTIKQLDRQLHDLSSWDDTYSFIENVNEDYIDSNLDPDTFANLHINLVYFLNTEFEPVWAQTYNFDVDDTDEVQISTNEDDLQNSILLFKKQLVNLNSLPDDEPKVIRGLFFQNGNPISFAMRPIFNNDEDKVSKGYMILGRTLNQLMVDKFSEQLKKKFRIEVIAKNPLSMSDFSKNQYNIDMLNKDMLKITKSYLENDTTVFKLSTEFKRVITKSGQQSLEYALFSLLAIGLLMILFISILLKNSVFLLLTNLTKQMQGITHSKNYTLRAPINSDDEIGILSSEFNNMLAVIEENNNDLIDANDQVKLANVELQKLSLTDPLTQITNRLGLDRKLRMEWAALSRTQNTLVIMMIDIDYFKFFNDYYGHLEGDKCLQIIANILKKNTKRPRDMVARFGGEEFTLVLPDTSIEAAVHIAEHIHNDIANSKLEHKRSDVSEFVTVSIGIANAIPIMHSSVDELMEMADKALYLAKQNGRNRFETNHSLNQ